MSNPTQINQGGAQNQEKQPKQQTGSQAGSAAQANPDKSRGELTEGRPHPTTPERQGGVGGP